MIYTMRFSLTTFVGAFLSLVITSIDAAQHPSTVRAVGWTSLIRQSHQRQQSAAATFTFQHIPRGGDSTEYSNSSANNPRDKNLVIIIDVDNTIYSERDLINNSDSTNPWHQGIESQIIRNSHLFGLKYFNLTSHQCDQLYRMYGSTVEGIRHMLDSQEEVNEVLGRFYREVYDPIDFSCLNTNARNNVRSGYDHGNALQKRRALAEFLTSISQTHSVYLASNSPRAHVVRVMNGMGLRGVRFAGIISPDNEHIQPNEKDTHHSIVFPTKASPLQYYRHVLEKHPVQSHRIILLDDSLHNIQSAETVGIDGIYINGQSDKRVSRTLEEGLAEALGHILPSNEVGKDSDSTTFTFSVEQYLHAKNKVDFNAINPILWQQLAEELSHRIEQKQDCVLRIADLGAGMLSMLELIILGGGEEDRAKPSLLCLVHHFLDSRQAQYADPRLPITHLEYYAYESNLNLLKGCKERLRALGFKEITSHNELSYQRLFSVGSLTIEVSLHLRPIDFQDDSEPPKEIDLIIGCCFADLFDPDQLIESLLSFARPCVGSQCPPPLVYFPITFSGTTQFCPPRPCELSGSSSNQMLPSDTTAYRIYAESLANHGHNLEPSRIVESIKNHGGVLITKGTSKWIIDPVMNSHLWETMMYFFGMSGAREMTKHQLDATGWIKRSRSEPRTIAVSNVDLLFRLQDDVHTCDVGKVSTFGNGKETSAVISAQEIQFVSPYNVTTITKRWDTTNSQYLDPNQIEIESVCSLISSGTELKIFKGSFESASLDVNIKGMADESMEYPLAYGYSLVGRVVACGADVEDADSLIGKLVFTFSAHSSRVIIDRDACQLVPDGIDAKDAIFMPSVETALSLVHDAHVRIGENAAVYGQGLIGLLVTSILSMQSPSAVSSSNRFSSVTAFDTLGDRLCVASTLGADSALQPQSASDSGPFDVSLEVSGNPRALQSAIDHTANNGRIIVGSWYGNSDVSLKLGIDFHRSHKTIQTSQVSTIPSSLAGLWSKERRFAMTWALVKAIRPSRLISKSLTLDDAQLAYELLDGGKEIAICFMYGSN